MDVRRLIGGGGGGGHIFSGVFRVPFLPYGNDRKKRAKEKERKRGKNQRLKLGSRECVECSATDSHSHVQCGHCRMRQPLLFVCLFLSGWFFCSMIMFHLFVFQCLNFQIVATR